ncbi:MAG: N-6 DNA methylase [Candidatus Obscuribacter sp.]|nr:N-6 DNA methylase [Candidatus Obscuribacter sp.]
MQAELLSHDLTLATERKMVRKLSKDILLWLKEHQDLSDTSDLEALLLLTCATYISFSADQLMQDITPDVVTMQAGHLLAGLKQNPPPEYDWLNVGLRLMQTSAARAALESATTLIAKTESSPRMNFGTRAAFVGTVYQGLSQARRKLTNKSIVQGAKQTEQNELIAFTQVLTPDWVVKLILSLALARGPALTHHRSLDELKSVTLLDPCVGTGNFIFGALDIFCQFYQGLGLTLKESFEATLANNLYGADLDNRAVTLVYLIAQALGQSIDSEGFKNNHIQCLPSDNPTALLGSLTDNLPPDHILQNKYDCVVTNPPYLGRKLLDRKLKEQLKKLYNGCQNELGHCFLSRALTWCKPGGKIGFITQSSILSLPSARAIRESLLSKTTINNIIEMGAGVFPLLSGEKASSAIVVTTVNRSEPDITSEVHYMDWTSREDKKEWAQKICFGQKAGPFVLRRQLDFTIDNGLTFNFKRPPTAALLYNSLPRLANLADIKQGLATSDNERFVRFIWEIAEEDKKDWLPYIKGKGTRRWYHPLENVIYWQDNGAAVKEAVNQSYPYLKGKTQWVVKNEDFYFKAGLTFSFVNSRALAVRKMPPGCIFDVGGSAIFSKTIDEDLLLAYLNSGLAMAFAQDLNPTINYQVGDLKRLPVPDFNQQTSDDLIQLARQATTVSRELYSFEAPYLMAKDLGNKIDEQAFLQYRKGHHLSQEKLIELDSRNDELVLKSLTNTLNLKESTEIISWIDSGWRKQTQRFKSKGEFILAILLCAWVKATGLSQDTGALSIISLNAMILTDSQTDSEFIWHFGDGEQKETITGSAEFVKNNLDQTITEFIHDINNQIKSLFMQQPPLFVLSLSDAAYIVPFAAITGSAVRLPGDWSQAAQARLDELKGKLSTREARAKQLMEILAQ